MSMPSSGDLLGPSRFPLGRDIDPIVFDSIVQTNRLLAVPWGGATPAATTVLPVFPYRFPGPEAHGPHRRGII